MSKGTSANGLMASVLSNIKPLMQRMMKRRCATMYCESHVYVGMSTRAFLRAQPTTQLLHSYYSMQQCASLCIESTYVRFAACF